MNSVVASFNSGKNKYTPFGMH